MPMNTISGRVFLRGTSAGIPGVIVVVQNRSGRPVPAETEAAADRVGVGDRLGSVITDATGSFTLSFEDDEFRVRDPDERRPDLQLSVLAPEEPGAEPDSRILFTSRDIRLDAGRTEQYLIRLPRDVLDKAGVAAPAEQDFTPESATSVSGRIEKKAAWRTQLVNEARRLTTEKVAAAREEVGRTDRIVGERVFDALAGMTAEEARDARIVRPGQPAAPFVWESAKKKIAMVNAGPGVVGYLVLTPEEAQAFREGEAWLTNAPAEKIEPFLYRADELAGRPTTITRIDPIEAICRPAEQPNPILSHENEGHPEEGGGTAPATPLVDVETQLQDLPRFVGRVINEMVSPDDPSFADTKKATAEQVQEHLLGLKIGSGPADVTAFHDYHNLQIAFDYVWKQLIDEEAVEKAKVLAGTINDAGGDAVAAVSNGTDPFEALRNETRIIARVNSPFDKQLPDWVRDDVGDLGTVDDNVDGSPKGGGGSSGGGGKPRPPKGGLTTPITEHVADLEPVAAHELLRDLEEILNENYKFEIFAPGSVNFGLMVTYRQKWEPITYQAGDLVNTVTLAPKEVRKVTSRRIVKRERSQRETETNLRNRTDESKGTARADAEVVDKASNKTTFNSNAKGSFDIGVWGADASTTIDLTAEAASQETKKNFHEDVLTAAMQIRSEKTWSFETKEAEEEETTNVSEIVNPNDELTVTYLYYELERRYRVSEHLHRLTPVVLVGMEVPNPSRRTIDKMLLKHSWVINRVLLDDRYRAPLDYLCNRIVGDELGLAEMARNLTQIEAAVEDLTKMHRDMEVELRAREASLDAAITRRAYKTEAAEGEGAIPNAVEWLFGEGDDEDIESARVVEDMRRDELERSVRRAKEMRMRLDAETATLDSASRNYARAYADHMNRMMEVGGLRAHIKENILYYMQAIWSFTFRDQTFFSLFKVKAPRITETAKTYSIAPETDPPLSLAAGPDRVVLKVTANYALNENITVEQDAVTLAEIADLDRPLGFKGNYMIFPLTKSNPLVDLMMVPYIDTELGLHDPDELGSWSPEDFATYARCLLKKHREADDLTEAEYKALENRLTDQYQRIVSSPRRVSDEIVVPTNSLFIEALPGKHALLEDFKLRHRQMDMEKAREEMRKLKLEGLRYAARILDKKYQDPEIERQIFISGGGTGGIVVPADQ